MKKEKCCYRLLRHPSERGHDATADVDRQKIETETRHKKGKKRYILDWCPGKCFAILINDRMNLEKAKTDNETNILDVESNVRNENEPTSRAQR